MPRFIVLRGTRPQCRRVINRTGRSPVLLDGEPVAVFANRRQANRAIVRTRAVRREIETAVVDVSDRFRDSPEFAGLFNDEPFTVVPVELIDGSGAVIPAATSDGWSLDTIVAVTKPDAARNGDTARHEPSLFEMAAAGEETGCPPSHNQGPED